MVLKANPTIDDVELVFNNIGDRGTRVNFTGEVPIDSLSTAQSHFKAVVSTGDKFLFAHTNLLDFEAMIDELNLNPTIVDCIKPFLPTFSNRNGKYLIADRNFCESNVPIRNTLDTDHSGWAHPCGAQVCGDFMAMGIEKDASGSGSSEIRIYDISAIKDNNPIKCISVITRSTGVNGVAMTKEIGDDGKYIVAAKQNPLQIYRSDSSILNDKTKFNEIVTFPPDSMDGVGMALVTQTNGTIYLFTFGAGDTGNDNHISLYKLNLKGDNPTCEKVGSKEMLVPEFSNTARSFLNKISNIELLELVEVITLNLFQLGRLGAFIYDYSGYALLRIMAAVKGDNLLNSSFRWGSGMRILSADEIEFYATDRNFLPGDSAGFSLVLWTKH